MRGGAGAWARLTQIVTIRARRRHIALCKWGRTTAVGGTMAHTPRKGCTLSEVVDDPMTRLMMASDGVSERDLVALLARVRRAIRTQDVGAAVPFRRPVRPGPQGPFAA